MRWWDKSSVYSLIHRECFGEETPALSFHELPRRTVSEMCGWCNGPRLLLCHARVSCTTENWQAGIVTGTTQGLSTGSQELGPSFLTVWPWAILSSSGKSPKCPSCWSSYFRLLAYGIYWGHTGGWGTDTQDLSRWEMLNVYFLEQNGLPLRLPDPQALGALALSAALGPWGSPVKFVPGFCDGLHHMPLCFEISKSLYIHGNFFINFYSVF